MTENVETRNSADWRKLQFGSIDDCVAEVNRIIVANDEGKLRSTGNWTPGQIMAHVASWIEYAYEGFPVGRPPFFVRWILRWRLKKMLANGMSRDARIPGVKEGTFGMDDMTTPEAAERLQSALSRLATDEPDKYEHPAFGILSYEDRIRLNLRHAELHLGFIFY